MGGQKWGYGRKPKGGGNCGGNKKGKGEGVGTCEVGRKGKKDGSGSGWG